MAWVRYDDNFHDHPKTAVVRASCPEALGLHLLANTWTSRSGRPGHVPTAVPQLLVGSAAKARKWIAALVEADLWVEVEGGWDFKNHAEYRASEKRQTPGTPADLSARRATAGRAGGHAKAAAHLANGAANQPTTASKPLANGAANLATDCSTSSKPSSNPCSPVVSTSGLRPSVLTPEPEPVPTTSAQAVPAATPDIIVAAFIDAATSSGMDRPGRSVIGRVAKTAKQLLADGATQRDLLTAATRLGANGWDDLEREVRRVQADQRRPSAPPAGMSTSEQRIATGEAIKAQLAANRAAQAAQIGAAS